MVSQNRSIVKKNPTSESDAKLTFKLWTDSKDSSIKRFLPYNLDSSKNIEQYMLVYHLLLIVQDNASFTSLEPVLHILQASSNIQQYKQVIFNI